MTSYLFKNKTKNILVMVFTALCMLDPICDAVKLIIQKDIMSTLAKILSLCPFVLILIYVLTLKKEYRFKPNLFPFSFLYLILKCAYAIFICFYALTDPLYRSAAGFAYILGASAFDIALLVCFVLCFIGSRSNFKRVIFFKLGTLLLGIVYILLPIVAFISVGGFDYINSVPDGYQAVSYFELTKCIISILFSFSLFALTLNKNNE